MLPNIRREIERAFVKETQKLLLSTWDRLYAVYSRLHEANVAWLDGAEAPLFSASEYLARRFCCCDGNHAGPPCGDPQCWNIRPTGEDLYEKQRADLESLKTWAGFNMKVEPSTSPIGRKS